jgi:aryl-alcohol dehydrogenase-like predicted oxidoreductase
MERPTSCKRLCKGVDLPTDDEVKALDAMRALKLRVRAIKKKISGISADKAEGGTESLSALRDELAVLKEAWNLWEAKRRRAARKRMILLGHEEEG